MQRVDSVNWGRIPPERRGRWGRWLYLERWNAKRQTQESVRATLAKMGNEISPSYYSEIESGKTTPNADWRAVFERLWGSSADDWDDPWDAPPVSTEGDLAAAIRDQTAAMRELVAELSEAREIQKGRDEGLEAALGRIAGTLERNLLVPNDRSR
jgi:hypothetical protein